MKRSLAVLLITTCAAAQSGDRPKLSARYAEAALRALAAIRNEQTAGSDSPEVTRAEAEIANARAQAVSQTDQHSLLTLRVFEIVHRTLLEQHNLISALYVPAGQKRTDESGLEEHGKCIAAWTDALRVRDPARPAVCDASKE